MSFLMVLFVVGVLSLTWSLGFISGKKASSQDLFNLHGNESDQFRIYVAVKKTEAVNIHKQLLQLAKQLVDRPFHFRESSIDNEIRVAKNLTSIAFRLATSYNFSMDSELLSKTFDNIDFEKLIKERDSC